MQYTKIEQSYLQAFCNVKRPCQNIRQIQIAVQCRSAAIHLLSSVHDVHKGAVILILIPEAVLIEKVIVEADGNHGPVALRGMHLGVNLLIPAIEQFFPGSQSLFDAPATPRQVSLSLYLAEFLLDLDSTAVGTQDMRCGRCRASEASRFEANSL